MTIKAWPFLVGRNRNLGYQTIVSPSFLSERGMSMLLAEAAGGDDSGSNEALYREISGSSVGDISLVFRVVKATPQDYRLGKGEILRDSSGRPIRLIEGFVMQGHHPMINVTQEDLQTAHELVKEAYHVFWQADNAFKVSPSLPFNLLRENDPGNRVRLIYDVPLFLGPSSSKTGKRAKQRAVFTPQPLWGVSLARNLAIGVAVVIVALSTTLFVTIQTDQNAQRQVSATASVLAQSHATTTANALAQASATATVNGPPTGFSVTSLQNGQAISQNTPLTITGQYVSKGAGLVWVLFQDSFENFYLQHSPVQFLNNGQWTVSNIIPRATSIKKIDFVSVTRSGNMVFQQKVAAGDFQGFTQLPDSSTILQAIPIVVSRQNKI